jgi:hypothetical protein
MSKETLNSAIFNKRLGDFIKLEEQGLYQKLNPKTGEPEVLGSKAKSSRTGVSFEQIFSICPPPFGELSKRLRAYGLDKILHGGQKFSEEGHRQVHCLDWLPTSKYSVDKLLWDCAEAVRFEQNYAEHVREIELIFGLQQREACIGPCKSLERAQDMRRLAVAVNPGLTTGSAMLQPIDDPMHAISVANKAKKTAVVRRFGCVLFPNNIQLRQIKQKTPALLAFNLKWLFQHWPITPDTGRQKRGAPPVKLSPPCLDLVADVVNAVFPETTYHKADTVKNLLKSIPTKAQFCGW